MAEAVDLPVALLFAAATQLGGCRAATRVPDTRATTTWPAPVTGERGTCADVADTRACWDPGTRQVALAIRPLPTFPSPSPLGWRCIGSGTQRSCTDRQHDATPFTCEDRRCFQRHPRVPDAGEWTCADLAGAVICTGGEPAAGVLQTPPDEGWICGHRAGKPGERLCLDLSPDTPDGVLSGWRCSYDHERGQRRRCDRDTEVHVLGDHCSATQPCVDGSRCVTGRCVPETVSSPSCWLDADCPTNRCRLGQCQAGTP